MDKETLQIIEEIATKAATKAATTAVEKISEIYREDFRLIGERMDRGFEYINRRFDRLLKDWTQNSCFV